MEKIELKTNELLVYLSYYFSELLDQDITIYERHRIINDKGLDTIDLTFYYVYEKKFPGAYIRLETNLKEEEIQMAMKDYCKYRGYELDNYKYIGGINRIGYYRPKTEAHFDGIELTVSEPEMKLVRN